jgi:HK97 family phage prohead protease
MPIIMGEMMTKLKKEIRCVELRDFKAPENENGDMILTGYASVFEKPTVLFEVDGVEYKEVIDRGAFNNTDYSLCCVKYNHENSVPILSRVRGGFTTLNVDDCGLGFNAKLFSTTVARDIYQIVKEGGLDKCSFAFSVLRDEYDRETQTRRILEIDKVFDISIVDIPAYDDTCVSARDYFKAEAEKFKKSLESEELKRKRAIAMSY